MFTFLVIVKKTSTESNMYNVKFIFKEIKSWFRSLFARKKDVDFAEAEYEELDIFMKSEDYWLIEEDEDEYECYSAWLRHDYEDEDEDADEDDLLRG